MDDLDGEPLILALMAGPSKRKRIQLAASGHQVLKIRVQR
jgi:hypothetical protein